MQPEQGKYTPGGGARCKDSAISRPNKARTGHLSSGGGGRKCLLRKGAPPHTIGRMLSHLSTGVCAGLGVAGAVGLAAGGCVYSALWPGSGIFGAALIAPLRPDELALTFDDGPNPIWTPRLLDVLAGYGVKATFFLLGSRAQAEPRLVRRIVEEGHLIGNHSWSHPNLALLAADRIRGELTRTSELLEQMTGERVLYFRPPFGARRPVVFKIARSLGLNPVLWNAMTSDWSEESADRIANQLGVKIDWLGRRRRAANIVLHDGGHLDLAAARGPSVTAAGLLTARYGETRRFVTLKAWGISDLAG
jgi:peptidoglycan-N-acetylglucosamine deacetylase